MYVLQVWIEGEWQLRGQYPTRKAAVLIGRDYLSRGFRAQVVFDNKVVWDSGYNPRCAVK